MIEDEESIPSILLCSVAGPIPRRERYDSSVRPWLSPACMRAFPLCSLDGWRETPRQIVRIALIPLEDRAVTCPIAVRFALSQGTAPVDRNLTRCSGVGVRQGRVRLIAAVEVPCAVDGSAKEPTLRHLIGASASIGAPR